MPEEEVIPPAGTETATDPDETEATALSVEMGGNRMVPLSALIAAKKDGKAARDRVKELEPIAASATEIGSKLNDAQPIINAILNNPKLRAEAMRISQGGTRTTADASDQPSADDDPDAAEFAELNNFYLADGMTLDVARGKRGLALLDRRSGRQTDERIRPLAGVTLGARANENIRAALSATDTEGNPWATRESIEEVVKQLPRELLADPQVADLILNNAIGIDRRKGRTPKAPDEPLFLERQGGGGRQRETALTPFERRHLETSGISEKDYRASAAKLATGRSIELGKG